MKSFQMNQKTISICDTKYYNSVCSKFKNCGGKIPNEGFVTWICLNNIDPDILSIMGFSSWLFVTQFGGFLRKVYIPK